MDEISLTIETNEVSFTIDMDDVTRANLSHAEITEITNAVEQLELPTQDRLQAVWDRSTKTLTLL